MLYNNSQTYNDEISKYLDIIVMTAYSLNPPDCNGIVKNLHNVTYINTSNSEKKQIHFTIHNHTLNKMIELIIGPQFKKVLISENKENVFYYSNSFDPIVKDRLTQMILADARLTQISQLDEVNKYYYVTNFEEVIFPDDMKPYANIYTLEEREQNNTGSAVLSTYTCTAPKNFVEEHAAELNNFPQHFDELFNIMNSNKLNAYLDFLTKSCFANLTKIHNNSKSNLDSQNKKNLNSSEDDFENR